MPIGDGVVRVRRIHLLWGIQSEAIPQFQVGELLIPKYELEYIHGKMLRVIEN